MIKIFAKKSTNSVNGILAKFNEINNKYYIDLSTIIITAIFATIKTVKKHEANITNLEEEIKALKSKGE